jgi:hypothetical protein
MKFGCVIAAIIIFLCQNLLTAEELTASQKWFPATNFVGSNVLSSNDFSESDLTPSVGSEIPNSENYHNSSYKLVLRRRHEGLVLCAHANATYGGKIVADYDIRSDGSEGMPDMTDEQIKQVWETNQIVFKGSYYRGRVFFTQNDSFSEKWITVFLSDDKRRIVFARDDGPIFFSGNAGVTWQVIDRPGQYDFSLCTSLKGSSLVAVISINHELATSNQTDDKMTKGWYSVVSAADGNQIALTGGGLQSAPALSIVFSNNKAILSWPTGLGIFILQQNADIGTTNWLDITNSANVIGNLFTVTIPASAGKSFFRLRTP